jgi:hypothetical protein
MYTNSPTNSPTMELEESVDEASRQIKFILDKYIPPSGGKLPLYKEPLESTVYPITASDKPGGVTLCQAYPHYMRDAEACDNPYSRNGLIFRLFRGQCGALAVFATRDGLSAESEKFGQWGKELNECIVAEYLRHGSEEQTLILTVVPLRICAHCLKQAERRYKCARCRAKGVHVRYCGAECQRAHWGEHRGVCSGL